MSKNGRSRQPSAKVLERIRSQAFASLALENTGTTHLSLVSKVYAAGHVLKLVDRQIRVPEDSIVVFVDKMPGANFGHPCRYDFHSPADGHLICREEALFPPEVADPRVTLEHFHAPLAQESNKALVYQAIDWAKIKAPHWMIDDNRYALLFTSQISNRRHVEDLEFAYRILRHKFGFLASHIKVLCYDGTIGATDASAAGMATWVGDGTPYQMTVNASATQANLQSALTDLSNKMNDKSLLFVHTNNHGSPSGLCVDNSGVVTPSEWGTMLAGMKKFGTLVVTMEQCYSGAFSQPTLDNSQATRTSFASAVPADKVSAGASHFDPWCLAWFEAMNGATAYGAGLAHNPDTSGNYRISVREAFNYSDAYDTASIDDPQYADSPVGCGHHIYLTKAPTLSDILADLAKSLKLIEYVAVKKPSLPDPPPELAVELLSASSVLHSVAERLEGAGHG
jgi:hypothetical protein